MHTLRLWAVFGVLLLSAIVASSIFSVLYFSVLDEDSDNDRAPLLQTGEFCSSKPCTAHQNPCYVNRCIRVGTAERCLAVDSGNCDANPTPNAALLTLDVQTTDEECTLEHVTQFYEDFKLQILAMFPHMSPSSIQLSGAQCA